MADDFEIIDRDFLPEAAHLAADVTDQVLSSCTTADIWALSSLNVDNKKESVTSERDLLCHCLSILTQSPAASIMIEEAKSQGWRAGFDSFADIDFYIDVPEKLILLSHHDYSAAKLAGSSHYMTIILLALVRALRDVWQEKRHGAFDERLSPEAILMHERIRAADCEAITTLVAWELRSEGHGDLWRNLIGSDDGDLALAFADYLDCHPSESFTHNALAVVFDTWFNSERRVAACDHQTLQYMDDVMEDFEGKNPFGRESLSPRDVEILSCMPDKSAYLRGHGAEILRDPYYAGMNDGMNQTHLFHIMRDLRIVYAGNVAFQDESLARKIFPDD